MISLKIKITLIWGIYFLVSTLLMIVLFVTDLGFNIIFSIFLIFTLLILIILAFFLAVERVEEIKRIIQLNPNLSIDKLSKKDIEDIKKKTDIKEIKTAFKFFEDQDITTDILIQKLKLNFAENKCISMNDDKTLEQNQILINSLEKLDNQIRAIFTVQKLNEG